MGSPRLHSCFVRQCLSGYSWRHSPGSHHGDFSGMDASRNGLTAIASAGVENMV